MSAKRGRPPHSIEPEQLQRALDAGSTYAAIAAALGCSERTVYMAVKRLGIARPADVWERHPELSDPDWLRREYVDKRRTTTEIAANFGIHGPTVSRALRRAGVPLRESGVRRDRPSRLDDTTWLTGQYIDERRSLDAIAGELGVTRDAVRNALVHAGVTIRPKRDGPLPAELSDADWLTERLRTTTAEAIGRELEVSPITVRRAARRQGLLP